MINKYFKSQAGVDTEQAVIQDMTTEVIQISGHDFVYIPRELNLTGWDNILHEAPLSTFISTFNIEGLVENASGFGDEQIMAAKFGLIIDQEIEISFSVPRFVAEVEMTRPVEGDLLYYSNTNSLFEITSVPPNVDFNTLNNMTRFIVKAKLFQYSDETLNTGINAVDDLNDNTRADDYADNDLFEGMAGNVEYGTLDPDNILGDF